MSDPRDTTTNEPHPASSHRTPHEIAEDEEGPIGGHRNLARKNLRAEDGPVRKLDKSPEEPPEPKSASKRRSR
ncbi:MAG TPA: hypothetical protein VF887_03035 [Gemmatimonadaceae bacterium]